MRKLIVIVAALLAPFAIWVAGCRQDSRRAAFPMGPEVKSLARSAEPELAAARAPVIPSIIDPEIMATPDQPTFARIRAVMDREAQLAGRYAEPGLFVLPRQDSMEMMAVLPEPAPARITTPLASRETTLAAAPPVQVPARQFWSASAASRPAPDAPLSYQHSDISAMAASRPPVVQPLPMRHADTVQSLPTQRFAPAAPVSELPFEAIPGIYMGTDDPIVDIPDLFGPFSSIPARSGSGADEGALAMPPSLTSAVFESVSVEDLNLAAHEVGGFRPPPNFDVKTLLPFSKTPAPETGSLSSGKGGVDELLNRLIAKNALEPLPDLATPTRRMDEASAPKGQGHLPLPIPEELIAAKPTGLETVHAAPKRVETREAPSRETYMTDFWESRLPKPPPLEGMSGLPDLPEPTGSAVAPRGHELPPPPPAELLRAPAPALAEPAAIAEAGAKPVPAVEPVEVVEMPAVPEGTLPLPPPELPVLENLPEKDLPMPKSILDMDLPELRHDLAQPLEAPPLLSAVDSPAVKQHTLVPLRPILEKADLKNPAITRIDAAVEAPPLKF